MNNVISKIWTAKERHPDRFYLTIILGLILLIYWQVYNFRFIIGWDDQIFVTNYYSNDGFTLQNFYDIITEFYRRQYAPVNQLYYTAMCSMFQYDPLYYHIGGVIIHIINVVFLYYLVKKIATTFCTGNKLNPVLIAFITTLLFAISPVNLEPVAWVAATKVTLYALFYFAALNSYINYLLTKKQIHYWLTLLWFLLSFGGKEQAVTLPICLLLLDFVYNQNFKQRSLWLNKMPFIFLSWIFLEITLSTHEIETLADTADFYPLYQRGLLFLYVIAEYLTKCVLPVNLSYAYPFPFIIGGRVPLWLWLYPTIIPFALYCLYRQLIKKWVLFGMLFFLIHILMVSNAMPLARFSITADRYVYVSSVGLYFIIAYVIVQYCIYNHQRNIVIVSLIIYCIYFFTYSYLHLGVWRNVLTLKQHMREQIKERPDYKAWRLKQIKNDKQK